MTNITLPPSLLSRDPMLPRNPTTFYIGVEYPQVMDLETGLRKTSESLLPALLSMVLASLIGIH